MTSKWTKIGRRLKVRYPYLARNTGTCQGLNRDESTKTNANPAVDKLTADKGIEAAAELYL